MADLLTALLDDVLPRAASAYIIGESEPALSDAVAARCGEYDTLTDLNDLADRPARGVVIITPDVLRLIGPSRTWRSLLQDASTLLQPGGTLVAMVRGDAAFAGLLTRVPVSILPDNTVPASGAQMRGVLRDAGHQVATVHLVYGDPASPSAIVADDAAEDAGPGSVPARLLAGAFREDGDTAATVLDPESAVDSAARAGALALLASAYIGVVGSRGRAVYATRQDTVIWADHEQDAGRWITGSGSVLDAPTLEVTMRQALASGDTPIFAEQAAQVGTWLRTEGAAITDLRFDEILDTANGLVSATITTDNARVEETMPVDRLLANAWWRFLHRLGPDHRTLPWPELTEDVALVRHWLTQSGVDPSYAEPVPTFEDPRSLHAALEQVSAAQRRAHLLEQRSAAMTDALRQRDCQLAVRETTIRGLREQVFEVSQERLEAEAKAAAMASGSAYRLANRITMVRQPKQLVRAIGNKLDGTVRTIRRMR